MKYSAAKLSNAPVSLIVPCFRCALTIQRALDSVFLQTLLPNEIILVDDFSQDGTLVMLEMLAQAHPDFVKIIKFEINKGAASARNAGWAAATQPYIAFLDADDVWHPSKLEIQYTYMVQNPNVLLSGHGYRLLPLTASPNWIVIQGAAQRVSKRELMLSNTFVTPSVMVRRDIPQRFVENQRYMEDHMLWMDIICSGGYVVKLTTELVALYKNSFGVSGLSSHVRLMALGEFENYKRLYDFDHINIFQFYALFGYSSLKNIRRLIIYGGYLFWRKKLF